VSANGRGWHVVAVFRGFSQTPTNITVATVSLIILSLIRDKIMRDTVANVEIMPAFANDIVCGCSG
jgi:hypothetical protein